MMELKMKDKIIVGVLLVMAVIVFIGGRIHSTRTSFDSEKWINYQANDRQLMIQNLVDRTRFVGMTREEVIAELGEAEDAQEDFLIYYVGLPQGLFGTKPYADVEYLVIEFTDEDKKDVVTASGVMTGEILPKESTFRIMGDGTGGTVLVPTE